jgi:hypothetical protein
MTVRRVNILCWSTAIVLSVGAGVAILMAILTTYDADAEGRSTAAAPAGHAVAAAAAPRLTMADFEPLLKGAFGGSPPAAAPATQPVAEAATPPPTSPPPPALQLLGTITEAGNDYAVFQTADGIQMKRVGETVGAARVTLISKDAVEVREGDAKPTTLQIPTPPSTPG